MKYPSQHQEESQQQLHSPIFPVHLQESTGHSNLFVRGISKTEETDSPAGDWLELRNLQSDRQKWTFHIRVNDKSYIPQHSSDTHLSIPQLRLKSQNNQKKNQVKKNWRIWLGWGWDARGEEEVDVVQILWLFVTQIGFPNSKSFQFIKWMLQWLFLHTQREQLITTCSKSLHLR